MHVGMDFRVTGLGNSINTLFVFVLFYVVAMVYHQVRLMVPCLLTVPECT